MLVTSDLDEAYLASRVIPMADRTDRIVVDIANEPVHSRGIEACRTASVQENGAEIRSLLGCTRVAGRTGALVGALPA